MDTGATWTVEMNVQGDPGTLGCGGRMVPERFPVETWPHSDDCPIPGVKDDNWAQIYDAGIDTVFVSGKKCGDADAASAISKLGDTKSPTTPWSR